MSTQGRVQDFSPGGGCTFCNGGSTITEILSLYTFKQISAVSVLTNVTGFNLYRCGFVCVFYLIVFIIFSSGLVERDVNYDISCPVSFL